jgi:hypothetical protein
MGEEGGRKDMSKVEGPATECKGHNMLLQCVEYFLIFKGTVEYLLSRDAPCEIWGSYAGAGKGSSIVGCDSV